MLEMISYLYFLVCWISGFASFLLYLSTFPSREYKHNTRMSEDANSPGVVNWGIEEVPKENASIIQKEDNISIDMCTRIESEFCENHDNQKRIYRFTYYLISGLPK